LREIFGSWGGGGEHTQNIADWQQHIQPRIAVAL
jgi:hypothetical protein